MFFVQDRPRPGSSTLKQSWQTSLDKFRELKMEVGSFLLGLEGFHQVDDWWISLKHHFKEEESNTELNTTEPFDFLGYWTIYIRKWYRLWVSHSCPSPSNAQLAAQLCSFVCALGAFSLYNYSCRSHFTHQLNSNFFTKKSSSWCSACQAYVATWHTQR